MKIVKEFEIEIEGDKGIAVIIYRKNFYKQITVNELLKMLQDGMYEEENWIRQQ